MALFKVFHLQTFAQGHLDPKSMPPLQAPLLARFLSGPNILFKCRKKHQSFFVHQSILVKTPLALSSSNIEVRPSWPEGGELRVWNIVNEQEQYTNNLFDSFHKFDPFTRNIGCIYCFAPGVSICPEILILSWPRFQASWSLIVHPITKRNFG